MRRFLVTGASGFIGGYVVSELVRRGSRVYGIGRAPLSAHHQAQWKFGDWNEGGVTADTLSALPDDIDTIFHCAGSGSVPRSILEPAADFESNVLTTQTVLEFARRRGGMSVVLLSSAGVYGAADRLPISVRAPCRPISPYGMNKLIGEMLARQYAQHFGVRVATVRLFSVYGSGLRKQLLWDASRKLLAGDMVFFGTGNETRDWIHVEDAARLIVASADAASTAAPVFNGGTGHALTIRSVVEKLAKCLDSHRPIEFNHHVRPGDPQHYEADIDEALALGWTPKISFDQGSTQYVHWLKSVL